MRFLEYQILKISFNNKSKNKKAHTFDPKSGLKMVGRACLYGLYGLLFKLFGECLSVCLLWSRLERSRFSHLVQYWIISEVLLVNCKHIQLSGYVLILKAKGRWFDCRVNPFILPTFLYVSSTSHMLPSNIEHWLWSVEVGVSTPKCT